MPVRKPLVYANGEVQVLQEGDLLFGPAALPVTNAHSETLLIATPVFLSGADLVLPARADHPDTKNVFGLVIDGDIPPGEVGVVAKDGVVSIPDWTLITGTSELVPGEKYYLSAALAGKLVAIPPNQNGQFIAQVGIAKNAFDLGITIMPPIGL